MDLANTVDSLTFSKCVSAPHFDYVRIKRPKVNIVKFNFQRAKKAYVPSPEKLSPLVNTAETPVHNKNRLQGLLYSGM